MRWAIGWIVWSTLAWGVAAEPPCYPPGGVAGIVVATVIVTCVVGGLGAALVYRYWWTPRQKAGRQRADHSASEQHQKNSTEFAFDNPYFRSNQEADDTDGADKGKSKLSLNNKNSLRSSKSEGKTRKGKGGKNPFVFGGGKKKAMDDSCIPQMEPERTVVCLRGHDFTGLGFNIMGNMRDGILVKDVLHRGPASESGLIKAGDKIVSVTVSFTNIVYEDALTILSYASPYDVQLEIERLSDKSSTPSSSKRLGSCSFSHSGQKLFHPLYRSQSIDDLTQIDRELPNGPRRSQSMGVAAHKLASRAEDRERMSLILSTTGSLNEKMLANVMAEGSAGHWKKRFEDSFESEESCTIPPKRDSSKKYLDGPHTRKKLEARRMEDEEGSAGSRRVVTEVNTWQPHQDDERDIPSQREEIPATHNIPSSASKNRLNLMEEDNNDSDVSKDSLEISGRGYQKRKPLRGSPLATPKKQPAVVTNAVQIESHPPSARMERIYANNDRACKSPPGHEEDRTTYASRVKPEGVTETADSCRSRGGGEPYRGAPKPPQGERQKLNSSDAYAQNYGCRTQVPNGGMDEHRGSKCLNMPSSSSSMYGRQAEPEDGRKVDAGAEGHQKFSKKAAPTPAGGMFTQINPFQMPSSKQRHFRPWGAREDLSKPPSRQSDVPGPKFTLRDSSMQHRQF